MSDRQSHARQASARVANPNGLGRPLTLHSKPGIQLTQIRAARLRERVNLHLALGGDFKGTGAPAK